MDKKFIFDKQNVEVVYGKKKRKITTVKEIVFCKLLNHSSYIIETYQTMTAWQ